MNDGRNRKVIKSVPSSGNNFDQVLGGSFLGKTTVINDIFDTVVCFELLSDESLGTKRLLIN